MRRGCATRAASASRLPFRILGSWLTAHGSPLQTLELLRALVVRSCGSAPWLTHLPPHYVVFRSRGVALPRRARGSASR